MSTIVLHNLPVGCMESDIHRALLIYGTAVNIEMDTRTSQAVVTMRTTQEAQALLNRHSVNVSGTSVRVDTQASQPPPPAPAPSFPPPHMAANAYPFSRVPGTMYATGMPATVSVPAAPPSHYAPSSLLPSSSSGGGGGAIMPAPPQTSRRLKVVVEDCRYPITRDVLLRMFSMIAPPVMVTCGPYGPTTTGMVEFAEAGAAQQAVDQFHSKAIYPDCCYVKLSFEPMWEVPVSTTSPAVGGGAGGPTRTAYPYAAQPSIPGNTSPYAAPPSTDATARYPGWDGRDDAPYYRGGGSREGSNIPFPPAMGGREQAYGDDGRREYVVAGGRGGGGPHGLMIRGGRGAARGAMRGGGVPGTAVGFSPYDTTPFPPHHPASSRAAGEHAGPGVGSGRPAAPPATDCAVLVSGVAESVPLYDLWVLLEVYGNVKSLKRQHTDHRQVVAQFQHATDTVLAVQYLHGCPFRGMKLRLKRFLGYHERNTEWNLGPATDPSTLAALFETGYHHRVAPHVPRNPHSAMYPDKNVFVSNLTEAITDYELEEMWRRLGFEPIASYRRGPKASIVGFKDIETAVNALIAVHLSDCHGRTLYATFSRFPPGPRPPKSADDDAPDGEQNDDDPQQEQGEEAGQAKQDAVKPPATAEDASANVSAPAEKAASVTAATDEAKPPSKAGKHKTKAAKK